MDEENLKWRHDLVDKVSYGKMYDPTRKGRNMLSFSFVMEPQMEKVS